MSEVEKMYENANVEREFAYLECHRGRSSICCPIEEYEKDDECMGCINSSAMEKVYEYPPFTAEKQIAILMFILNKFGDIGFQKMYSIRGNDESTRKDFIKCLCDCEHETWDSRPVDFYYQKDARGDNLEESIASLINNLWQDLTEEEKQQVKGILE